MTTNTSALDQALQAQSQRAHEIQDVITFFFLKLTSRMNCSPTEIAEGLVGAAASYIAVAAMPNERAEVADAFCAELKRRVTKR